MTTGEGPERERAEEPASLPTGHTMATDQLRLRTIVVSGRSALHKTRDPGTRQRIRGRMVELLGALEDRIARDGADPEMLSAIRRTRSELRP